MSLYRKQHNESHHHNISDDKYLLYWQVPNIIQQNVTAPPYSVLTYKWPKHLSFEPQNCNIKDESKQWKIASRLHDMHHVKIKYHTKNTVTCWRCEDLKDLTGYTTLIQSGDFILRKPVQCESKKSPWVKKNPLRFSDIFPKRLGIFLINFLHTYYTFLSTLDYKFLFSYLLLWRSYAILSETTHRFFYISLEVNF